MDKPPEKKLKRGLEDISPLFQHPPAPASSQTAVAVTGAQPSFEVQFLTVCVPDIEGDAFFANTYVASQLVRQTNLLASLVSIAPGFNTAPSKTAPPFPSLELLDARISRLILSHQELWSLSQNGSAPPNGSLSGRVQKPPAPCLVFLDFEPAHFHSLGRISLLLDRTILFVQSTVESLQEAYRLMKILSKYNREIEFLLLFRGKVSESNLEEFLFERFSLIASRFLGISLRWLGDFAGCFNLDPVLEDEGLRRPLAPEKSRLWQKLQKILQIQLPESSSNPFLPNLSPEPAPFSSRPNGKAAAEPIPHGNGTAWNRLSREELRDFIQLELEVASRQYKA